MSIRMAAPRIRRDTRASTALRPIPTTKAGPTTPHTHPVLLFPLRLETLLTDTELKVRIYPDQLVIDTHEAALTRDEYEEGKKLRATFQTPVPDDKRAAWRALVAKFGAPRATWIAKTLLAETVDDAALETELRDEAWTVAPKVRAMPDRFLVSLYDPNGAHIVKYDTYTSDVATNLAVLRAPDATSGDDDDLYDEVSLWTVDFDSAIDAGMAVSIPLDPGEARAFGYVLAVGLRAGNGGTELADLLEVQRYTNGLSCLPHGTATNNTSDTAAGSPAADAAAVSYTLVTNPPQLDERSCGWRLARTLGLATATLAGIEGAEDKHESYASEVHRLLWPATGGHFCGTLLKGVIPPDDIARLRDHFVDFVRGRGHLPALRIGGLPYGILPVGRLAEGWEAYPKPASKADVDPQKAFEKRLHTVVSTLADGWLARASRPELVPRISTLEAAQDPDAELLGILSMMPASVSWRKRPFVDERFAGVLLYGLRNYFFGPQSRFATRGNPSSWVAKWIDEWGRLRAPSVALLHELGASAAEAKVAPILRLLAWGESRTIHQELVGDANAALRTIISGGMTSVASGDSLFAEILFHAFRLDDDTHGFRTAARALTGGRLTDLVNQTVNVADLIALLRNELDVSVSSGLDLKAVAHDILTRRPLKGGYASLAGVYGAAKLPAASLARVDYEGLVVEALDTQSHRLDAWLTSIPARRLDEMRADKATRSGIVLGAYGWVEDLRLEQDSYDNAATDAGFIHAPSLGHAAAAAVARSGYITHATNANGNPFSLDITSERVQRARWLIDGMQAGQPLAALLGYQFERGLHTLQLDRFIDELRDMHPLTTSQVAADGQPAEAISSRLVVDGLALSAESDDDVLAYLELDADDEEASQGIVSELHRLRDALDAVTDVLVFESLYQSVQANYERSGAALDAASGGGRPPTPESTRTPTRGVGLRHRVCVMLSAAPSTDDADAAPNTADPRRAAEPRLAAWVESILGSPSTISCRARSGAAEIAVTLGAAAAGQVGLGLGVLDILYASAVPPSGGESELERRLRYAVRAARDLACDAVVELDLGSAESGTRSVAAALEVTRRILALAAESAVLRPDALHRPEELPLHAGDDTELDALAEVDLDELANRVDDALGLLSDQILADGRAGKDRLLAATAFGIPDAVPAGPTDPTLPDRLQRVLRQASERSASATTLLADARNETRSRRQRLESALEAMRTIFGSAFVVLPVLDLVESDVLAGAFGDNGGLADDEDERVEQWLAQVAETHPTVRRFEDVLMAWHAWAPLDAALVTEMRPRVAQLPRDTSLAWQALSDDEIWGDDPPPERPRGITSIVALRPAAATSSSLARVAGLLVDEWSEVQPLGEVTTGVAFHRDAPSAQAPSALLLAVPGQLTTKTGWTPEELRDIVRDTADLTRIRLVDPDALRAVPGVPDLVSVGGLAPALMLPLDPRRAGAKPSVDLPTLAELRQLVDHE